MRRLLAPAWLLSLALAAAPALAAQPAAQPAAQLNDSTKQARTLFDAGAQAYATGQFVAAIQAFEEAYRLTPRPGLLFSIAQAQRRQYYVDKKPEHLLAAIRFYRDYVSKVEQGGRRADAAQALAELEPLAERLGKEPTVQEPSPSSKPRTRLMIYSQVSGAMVGLDGGKPVEAPLAAEVKPGKHTLRATAPGFFDEEREIQAAEGGVVALEIPLRERPARLSVKALEGAQISIDGRLISVTPLSKPLEIASGEHLVTVTRNGYKPFSQELELGRGEDKAIDARLERTTQRTVSYAMLISSGGFFVAGGLLAVFAGYNQQKAELINIDRTGKGNLTLDRLSDYENAKEARDRLRAAGGVALGAGAVAGGMGFLLFMFNQPTEAIPSPRFESKPKPAPSSPPARDMPMEMGAAPILGPGLYGVAVSGRF